MTLHTLTDMSAIRCVDISQRLVFAKAFPTPGVQTKLHICKISFKRLSIDARRSNICLNNRYEAIGCRNHVSVVILAVGRVGHVILK